MFNFLKKLKKEKKEENKTEEKALPQNKTSVMGLREACIVNYVDIWK